MSPTNVELYEALKPTVGEKAARMMAEVVPVSSEVATKADIAATKADLTADIAATRADLTAEIAATRADLSAQIAVLSERITELGGELRGEIKDAHLSNLRWMFGLFVPLWAGTWATVVAVIVKL